MCLKGPIYFILQIYNEMIRDLLNPTSGYLDLREDAKGEIRIAGITEFSTNNAKEARFTLPNTYTTCILKWAVTIWKALIN